MWLFYTLLAAVCWGVGQIFVKKGLQDISPLMNNILATIIGTLLFLPFALSHQVHFDKFWQLFPFTCFVSFLFFAYYYVIGRGQLALTGTILGTYPFITVILSLLFLHEAPSIFQKLAIGTIILGTVIVALPNKVNKIHVGTWLWWTLLGVFMLGLGDFLVKFLMNQSDLYTYLFTYAFGSTFVTILFYLFDKKGRALPKFTRKNYFSTLIGVGLVEFGFFLFHLAVNGGLVSLVSPISGIYVAITAVLAWFVLKEKIDKKHAFGIILAAIGVILIGIS